VITAAIKQKLDGTTAVNDLLGGRLYPGELPKRVTFPAARYTLVSDVGDFQMRGPTDLRQARIQIDVFDPSMDDAFALASKIETALAGFSGTIGSSPNQHVVQMIECGGIQQIFSDGVSDAEEPRGLHGYMADYMVWYLNA
jgi:hypothetical protein